MEETNENVRVSPSGAEKLEDKEEEEGEDDEGEEGEAKDYDFDFENFYTNLKKSISENVTGDEDVDLKYYLLAYDQLYNFFLLLGGAFQFVASDVKSKIKILNKFYNDELEQNKTVTNFSTVKSMVNYEKNSGLLKNNKYVSGSRTLLRLHRGLDFIKKFLEELYNLENSMRLGVVARQTYDNTLAEYHTWVVRNAARIAMQFLPTREELFNKITKNDEEKLNQILEIFPDSFDVMKIVYERVQVIYDTNEILNLS